MSRALCFFLSVAVVPRLEKQFDVACNTIRIFACFPRTSIVFTDKYALKYNIVFASRA